MNLQSIPSAERPREKLLAHGSASLSDAELLAILLRVGLPGCNAVELGQRLLIRSGGLSGLLQLPVEDWLREPGLGPAKCAQLLAATELSRRCLRAEIERGDCLRSPTQTALYLRSELANERNEVFAVLFLDSRNRIIAFEKLFQGSIDSASVHPRVIVQRALSLNAAAVILTHNHPSGVSEASAGDELLTRQLQQALALIDVRVLDHIIVAGNQTLSLAQRGLL